MAHVLEFCLNRSKIASGKAHVSLCDLFLTECVTKVRNIVDFVARDGINLERDPHYWYCSDG